MEKEMGCLIFEGMKPVYVLNDNIITSLGFTTADNIFSLEKGVTGITTVNDPELYPNPVQLSHVDTEQLELRFKEVLNQVKGTSPAEY